MDNNQINSIIAEQNAENERIAAGRARQIIQAIGREQEDIANRTRHIEELRAELKTLEVKVVSPISILGA